MTKEMARSSVASPGCRPSRSSTQFQRLVTQSTLSLATFALKPYLGHRRLTHVYVSRFRSVVLGKITFISSIRSGEVSATLRKPGFEHIANENAGSQMWASRWYHPPASCCTSLISCAPPGMTSLYSLYIESLASMKASLSASLICTPAALILFKRSTSSLAACS